MSDEKEWPDSVKQVVYSIQANDPEMIFALFALALKRFLEIAGEPMSLSFADVEELVNPVVPYGCIGVGVANEARRIGLVYLEGNTPQDITQQLRNAAPKAEIITRKRIEKDNKPSN